jgi:hypothetical protein
MAPLLQHFLLALKSFLKQSWIATTLATSVNRPGQRQAEGMVSASRPASKFDSRAIAVAAWWLDAPDTHCISGTGPCSNPGVTSTASGGRRALYNTQGVQAHTFSRLLRGCMILYHTPIGEG